MTSQTDFNLVVEATCDVTTFKDWNLDGQTFQQYVRSEGKSFAVGPVQDAVSQVKGNNDGVSYCGNRVYKILNE